MQCTLTPRGPHFPTSSCSRFGARVLRDILIFSPTTMRTAAHPPSGTKEEFTILNSAFPNLAALWQSSYRDPSSDCTTTEPEQGGWAGKTWRKEKKHSIQVFVERKSINKKVQRVTNKTTRCVTQELLTFHICIAFCTEVLMLYNDT